MIEKININSKEIDVLENIFFNVFTKSKVIDELKHNTFTNYYMYKIDNKPVAFINYYVMYERAELININVLDNYQNQKIASKLIEYMINDCQTKSVNSITLEVKITNEKAIHLYKKFGFEQVSIRKSYYQGIDGILMEKELM